MSGDDLITVKNLHFTFSSGRKVLNGVNLSLRTGERLALLGANGAGKSSLLHCLMGLAPASSGEITILGSRCDTEAEFRTIRGRVGLLFQDSDDQLFCPTVLEDVMFGPLNLDQSREDAGKIALQTLSDLGLDGFENRITYQLSGGEKRLVALATVLAMSPEILLLDEPTNGLDADVEKRLIEILRSLPQAMLIISHDRLFLDQVATRSVLLQDGVISQA
ncbi:MAG: energy-coupling factor ABC transporter ATP-binding protein [Thalassospira sp.]|uniref:energy-coupling factor ABC transporter ATP-binding protein n=1 Tax=Thalassospira sp. TaxID=1912094 RepID=UPI000C6177B3|nr:ABC transporter ATP-binding protein [Thalassospira sp.]MAZ33219.1 energy-coupling factor ABC transporter ATP-binding protein [Thalassospira sp.]|tara:strand:+ start:204 stop:863 length:660 start_codon:yes stop_codon:yes gene_type:complete